MIEQFEQEYWAYHGITVLRRREQHSVLLRFQRHIAKPLEDATDKDLQAFLLHLVDVEKLAPSMVDKVRKMIRPLYKWAGAAGLVPADRVALILAVTSPRAGEIRKDPRPYSRVELDAFYATLAERYPLLSRRALMSWEAGRSSYGRVYRHGMRLQLEAACGLALYCALRRTELFTVTLDTIAVENEYVPVLGKGGAWREVPYPDDLRRAVSAWVAWREQLQPGHDKVWLSLWGGAGDGPTTPMFERRFHTLLSDTLGDGWTWHRFRHTAGTEWLRAGMTIEKVQMLLGHATISQTLAYARVANSDVHRSMRHAEPRFTAAVGPRAAAA